MSEPKTEHPDWAVMRHAIGDALLSWGYVENALAEFLNDLVHHPDRAMAAVIYFSPNNTETRLYIVDNVVSHILQHTPMNFGPELFLCWQKVLSKINKYKESRNHLAHGEIIEWHKNGKIKVRLTASVYDVSRHRKDTGQIPGISINDVNHIGSKFGELIGLIRAVRKGIHQTRFEPFEFPASRDRVRELAIHLKTSVPSLGVRFDKGLPAQPQPFEQWEALAAAQQQPKPEEEK